MAVLLHLFDSSAVCCCQKFKLAAHVQHSPWDVEGSAKQSEAFKRLLKQLHQAAHHTAAMEHAEQVATHLAAQFC